MRFLLWKWDWRDWSLNRIVEYYPSNTPKVTVQVFALRCAVCLRFSRGCAEHWFCGLCRQCADVEDAA